MSRDLDDDTVSDCQISTDVRVPERLSTMQSW